LLDPSHGKLTLAPKPKNDLRKLLTEGTGQATIAFVVDVNGKTTNVQIARATSQEFGDIAKKAVEQWTFSPGMMKGKPVAVRMMFPLTRK
jgi:TonB family protein